MAGLWPDGTRDDKKQGDDKTRQDDTDDETSSVHETVKFHEVKFRQVSSTEGSRADETITVLF